MYFESDSDDLDFTPEANSDSELSEIDPETDIQSHQNNITLDFTAHQLHLAQTWNEIKSEAKTPKNRYFSIYEHYKSLLNKSSIQTYEFAGHTYTTNRADLSKIKINPQATLLGTEINEANLKNPNVSSTAPRIKKSRLANLANKYKVSETIRLNTMEKSKIDWNKYVLEEGIKDDLKLQNKDGFLEKQAFLKRTIQSQEENIQLFKQEKTKRN